MNPFDQFDQGNPFDQFDRTADKKKDIRKDGWARAITQGASLGFADELEGLKAGRDQLVGNAIRRVRGKPIERKASDAYRQTVDFEREVAADYAKRHPVASVSLNVLGGIATGGVGAGAIKGATSLAGAVGRSAAVGAGYGALAGAGTAEGNLAQRGRGAVTGAAVGAVTGAALPAAARGAQTVGNRVASGTSEATARIASQFGRTPPPAVVTERATSRAEALIRDMAARRGVTPEAIMADPAVMAGKPITGAEVLGREAMTQLTAIGRRGGQTGDVLEDVMRGRSDGQGARVVDDFAKATGIPPEAVADDFAALSAALRARAKPAYDAAYAKSAPIGSDEMDELLKRPAVQAALGRAINIAKEEGRDPKALGLVMNTRREVRPGSANDTRAVTRERLTHGWSTQTVDYIKRGLDDIIEGYRDPTTRRLNLDEAGRAIVGTHKRFRDEAVRLNPSYGEALQAGGEPLRLEQAWRDAPKLLSNNTPARVFQQRWAALGEGEQNAARGAFANDLMQKAQAGRLRPRELRTPAFRRKLQLMIGEQSDDFLASVEQEMRLARGSRMSPGTNSVTAEVLEANREMDRGAGFVGELQRRADAGQNPLQAATGAGMNALASPFAGFVRGVQAPYGQAVRDEMGRILLSPEEVAEVLRRQPIQQSFNPLATPYMVGPGAGFLASR